MPKKRKRLHLPSLRRKKNGSTTDTSSNSSPPLDIYTPLTIVKEASHVFPPLLTTVACIAEILKTVKRVKGLRPSCAKVESRLKDVHNTLQTASAQQSHPKFSAMVSEFESSLNELLSSAQSLQHKTSNRFKALVHLTHHEETLNSIERDLDAAHSRFKDKLALLNTSVVISLPDTITHAVTSHLDGMEARLIGNSDTSSLALVSKTKAGGYRIQVTLPPPNSTVLFCSTPFSVGKPRTAVCFRFHSEL